MANDLIPKTFQQQIQVLRPQEPLISWPQVTLKSNVHAIGIRDLSVRSYRLTRTQSCCAVSQNWAFSEAQRNGHLFLKGNTSS